jgi:Tfp pilus assembly major pilin PilA
MIWMRMLAYITGTVDQELLLRNEYLAAENRILRKKIKGRLLSNSEKTTLAEIAHRLGRKALADVAAAAKTRCSVALVSRTDREEVRWLEVPEILGTSSRG